MDTITEITSMEELNVLIKKSNTHFVLLYIFAEWCAPCQLLSPAIDALKEEFHEMEFARVNVDTVEEIKSQFDLQVVPACIIFGEGENIYTFYGAKRAALREILCKMTSQYCF